MSEKAVVVCPFVCGDFDKSRLQPYEDNGYKMEACRYDPADMSMKVVMVKEKPA